MFEVGTKNGESRRNGVRDSSSRGLKPAQGRDDMREGGHIAVFSCSRRFPSYWRVLEGSTGK